MDVTNCSHFFLFQTNFFVSCWDNAVSYWETSRIHGKMAGNMKVENGQSLVWVIRSKYTYMKKEIDN